MDNASGGYSYNVYVRGGDSASLGVNGVHVLNNDVKDEHVHRERGSDVETVWPKGMVNVGNSCYANAALQCLLSTALANALLDPGTVRVFRRYSSNPAILEKGSGSVDSEDDDGSGAADEADSTKVDSGSKATEEDDEDDDADLTTVSTWRPPSPEHSRRARWEEHQHESSTEQTTHIPPLPPPPPLVVPKKQKLTKRQRRRKEREQRRMHKTCLWLTQELRSITLEYTEPSISSSSSYHMSNGRGPSFGPKLLDWLGGSDPTASGRVINPGGITRHPDHLSKCLRPYRQEDAHEFLRALLSTLVMNGHNRQLSSLFDGLLESSVTCQTCRRPSLTRDRYMDLSLDIFSPRIVTLKDALNEFTKTEILTGENKVFCSKCKTKRTAAKGLRLATAPSILVCHLKRFAFDDFGRLVRLHKCIEFPLQLDITPCMSKVNKSRPPPYELVGVLVHQGRTCDSGHYLAYVKSDGEWFKCNDSVVTRVDVKSVLKQQAYILMYEVAEMRSRQNGLHSPAIQRHEARGDHYGSRARSTPRSRAHPGTNFMSYLCGIEVMDHPFLRDLCYDPSAAPIHVSGKESSRGQNKIKASHTPDPAGVELVASLRDDLNLDDDPQPRDEDIDDLGGSERIGPSLRFRKASSHGNYREKRTSAASVPRNITDYQTTRTFCSTSDPGGDNNMLVTSKALNRRFPTIPPPTNTQRGDRGDHKSKKRESGKSSFSAKRSHSGRTTPTGRHTPTGPRRKTSSQLPPLPKPSPTSAEQRRHSSSLDIYRNAVSPTRASQGLSPTRTRQEGLSPTRQTQGVPNRSDHRVLSTISPTSSPVSPTSRDGAVSPSKRDRFQSVSPNTTGGRFPPISTASSSSYLRRTQSCSATATSPKAESP